MRCEERSSLASSTIASASVAAGVSITGFGFDRAASCGEIRLIDESSTRKKGFAVFIGELKFAIEVIA